MRVLLASSPHRDTFGYSMPPPGLLRLGGECLRRGIDVRLDDLAFRLAAGELDPSDELCASAARHLLAGGEPDVLGLSVMGATVPAALEIARLVRARSPRTRILFGGPGVHGIDAALVGRFGQVDACLRGEGEETLPAALERFARGADLAGVAGATWRDASGRVRREKDREPMRALDSLPEYAWELLPPLARYKALTGEAEGLTPIDSGRGCVYDCSFCTIGRFWGRRSRPLPVRRLVREVLALAHIEGAKNAYLCHDLFGADRAHALAFCDALIEQGSPIPWECRARVDHVDPELAERMARAGCYRVLFGIESGDAHLCNAHDKHLAQDLDVLGRIGACVEHGITPILSIILGLPGEDDLALARTLELAARAALAGGVQLSFHLVNPQPGCRLGEEHGAQSRPVEGIPPDMAFGAGTTAPERALIESHPDLFGTWSLLTSAPGGEARLRSLHTLAQNAPELLMRYPRAVLALAAHRGEGVLDLLRAWHASGRSFEGFARTARDPLVDGAVRWEQAVARASAPGATPAANAATVALDPGRPRSRAELVRTSFEPREFVHALTRGATQSGAPSGSERVLAVVGTKRGARTLVVSNEAALLLHLCDGTRTLSELEALLPSVEPALRELAQHGLLDL